MTAITFSSGGTVNLNDAEDGRLQAALALRQFGEAGLFL